MSARVLRLEPRRAVLEAEVWFRKLRKLSISVDELRRFQAWKADPENKEAYDRLSEWFFS